MPVDLNDPGYFALTDRLVQSSATRTLKGLFLFVFRLLKKRKGYFSRSVHVSSFPTQGTSRTYKAYTHCRHAISLCTPAILKAMEYQVPQFIEVEDKIIGPLTLKQFIYVAGGGGLCVVFFFYLPTIVALLLSVPAVALAAALAFYKVNGKPFIEVLEAGFNYYTRGKLFLWKHLDANVEERNAAKAATTAAAVAARAPRGTPKLTRGKLSELAWSLDVNPVSSSSLRRES